MPDAYIVRFGSTRTVAEFTFKGPQDLKRSDSVLIRSTRGVEWGEVLCPATDTTRKYIGSEEQVGRILRRADDEAWTKRDEMLTREQDVFAQARQIIRDQKLNMNLVDVECIFGGERVVFYYLSEQRIDFRELVKTLARSFQTRIEMRQIGVRDEARLLADFGDCGRPVCCGSHLQEMPPVSMKMAKMQKATLDPNKISGRCGRLKCCLRYEFDTYEEYRRELPSNGTIVVTKQGQGKVVAQEILAKKVLVSYDGGRRMIVDLSEILTTISSKNGGTNASGKSNPDRDRSPDTNGGATVNPSKATEPDQTSPSGDSNPDRP
ncbi:MAG: regulatory iron-sulfur-containing complex subunit RicT [Planctomycetota bacterium]|nr:regulatory iron-sulfur-containing complex subunit RicT [Planctomycetota bacterium]